MKTETALHGIARSLADASLEHLRARAITEHFKGDKQAYEDFISQFPEKNGDLRQTHESFWLKAKFPAQLPAQPSNTEGFDPSIEQCG